MQIATGPPTLVFFCNDADLFNDSYKKFLERKLRDALQFDGTPIKMIFRGKAVRDASRELQKNPTFFKDKSDRPSKVN
jgi:GTP-binding protein